MPSRSPPVRSHRTYAQLDADASKVAAGLVSLGIAPGDHVALSCPNLPAFPVAYFGILKAGAVVVPLNVLLKPREIAYHLRDSDARALIAFEGTPELPMARMARAGVRRSGVSASRHHHRLTRRRRRPCRRRSRSARSCTRTPGGSRRAATSQTTRP